MTLLSSELSLVCSKISSDDSIRVVVVTGSSDNVFSLGECLSSDIFETQQDTEAESCALAEPVAGISQPVIAGINGNVE